MRIGTRLERRVQAHVFASQLLGQAKERRGTDPVVVDERAPHVARLPIRVPGAERIESVDAHAMISSHGDQVSDSHALAVQANDLLRLQGDLGEASGSRRRELINDGKMQHVGKWHGEAGRRAMHGVSVQSREGRATIGTGGATVIAATEKHSFKGLGLTGTRWSTSVLRAAWPGRAVILPRLPRQLFTG